MVSKPSRSTRILVVDDSNELRQTVGRILSGFGFQLILASSGNQALSMLRSEGVDLIISDVQMPDGDGFTLLKGLHSLPNGYPPVILMSGGLELSPEELRQVGASAFLSKPFEAKHVLSLVCDLTRRVA